MLPVAESALANRRRKGEPVSKLAMSAPEDRKRERGEGTLPRRLPPSQSREKARRESLRDLWTWQPRGEQRLITEKKGEVSLLSRLPESIKGGERNVIIVMWSLREKWGRKKGCERLSRRERCTVGKRGALSIIYENHVGKNQTLQRKKRLTTTAERILGVLSLGQDRRKGGEKQFPITCSTIIRGGKEETPGDAQHRHPVEPEKKKNHLFRAFSFCPRHREAQDSEGKRASIFSVRISEGVRAFAGLVWGGKEEPPIKERAPLPSFSSTSVEGNSPNILSLASWAKNTSRSFSAFRRYGKKSGERFGPFSGLSQERKDTEKRTCHLASCLRSACKKRERNHTACSTLSSRRGKSETSREKRRIAEPLLPDDAPEAPARSRSSPQACREEDIGGHALGVEARAERGNAALASSNVGKRFEVSVGRGHERPRMPELNRRRL